MKWFSWERFVNGRRRPHAACLKIASWHDDVVIRLLNFLDGNRVHYHKLVTGLFNQIVPWLAQQMRVGAGLSDPQDPLVLVVVITYQVVFTLFTFVTPKMGSWTLLSNSIIWLFKLFLKYKHEMGRHFYLLWSLRDTQNLYWKSSENHLGCGFMGIW